jgi:2-polyprenyl-6-methoxyphenol hydroxylase-like FAD-dependent oxidoreductase
MTFAAETLPPRRDLPARFDLLDREFDGVGWRSREFLEAARIAPDFALDTYDQMHMPGWASGRVILIGDAAWCASPLSGLGTALGLRGAAALADALAGLSDVADDDALATALAEFTDEMRPRVTAAQKLIPGRVSMIAPRGRIGIWMNALMMRVIQWRILLPLMARVAAESGHEADAAQALGGGGIRSSADSVGADDASVLSSR